MTETGAAVPRRRDGCLRAGGQAQAGRRFRCGGCDAAIREGRGMGGRRKNKRELTWIEIALGRHRRAVGKGWATVGAGELKTRPLSRDYLGNLEESQAMGIEILVPYNDARTLRKGFLRSRGLDRAKQRLPLATREVLTLRDHRYSKGLRSVQKDLGCPAVGSEIFPTEGVSGIHGPSRSEAPDLPRLAVRRRGGIRGSA